MSEEREGAGSEDSGLPAVVDDTVEPAGAGGLPPVVGGAIDAIWDLATGVPAPIRKNAIKAFARLFTTVVQYPAVRIEGAIAERRAESAERLAESRARVKLIETSARQLAKQMETSPEYARAAAAKFAEKIIRERVNIDQIVEIAAEELQSEPVSSNEPEQPEAPSISDDWLNVFENEAAPITSEQMRRLFGKILAGEIRRPQSYSVKTLRLVAQLDNRPAELFRLLCSISVSLRLQTMLPPNTMPTNTMILDARVVSLAGNAASSSLAPYGLNFDALNILNEYGLIIADYNSIMDYRSAILLPGGAAPLPLTYQNAPWMLVPKTPRDPSHALHLSGVGLSYVGRELLPIVEITPNEAYTAAL
jgi:hypothetical protein